MTTTTIIDVSTEAGLDAAIAEANAGASGSSFEIVLQADITENYVLVNAVDLPSGVTLSINDGTLHAGWSVRAGSGDHHRHRQHSYRAGGQHVPSGEMIAFAGIPGTTKGVLDIAAPTLFSGTVEGFASGDELAISSTITGATPRNLQFSE